jgi:hypothetical protein
MTHLTTIAHAVVGCVLAATTTYAVATDQGPKSIDPTFPPLSALRDSHRSYLPPGPFKSVDPSTSQKYRSLWPSLKADDTPPYPQKGFEELQAVIQGYAKDVGASETLILVAELDADGNVSNVRALKYNDDQLLKRAVWAVVDTPMLPALCSGVPCKSTLPIIVKATK